MLCFLKLRYVGCGRADRRSDVLMALRFQFGEYNLGLFIWPFENDFVFVEAPKDNLHS